MPTTAARRFFRITEMGMTRAIKVADKGAQKELRNGLPKLPPQVGLLSLAPSLKVGRLPFPRKKIAMTKPFFCLWNQNDIIGYEPDKWLMKSP